jgi:predicted amidohydrolase YtcJ
MADVIVRNARIITMNAHRPTAEALSIRRGFIQSIGGVDEVMRHRTRAIRLVDLGADL